MAEGLDLLLGDSWAGMSEQVKPEPLAKYEVWQGPWATLNVEWRNDRGAWERHSIHMIGTDENRTNHVTLDNGVTEYDPARLRPWHTPSSEDPKTGQENTHAD